MSGLIENYLNTLAEVNQKYESAVGELKNARKKVSIIQPKLIEQIFSKEDNKNKDLTECMELTRQILSDRYHVYDLEDKVASCSAKMDKLIEKFHGRLDVNIGEFVEELESVLKVKKGTVRVELLDGDEGQVGISGADKSVQPPLEAIKNQAVSCWNQATMLFTLDYFYPVMTTTFNPKELKFLDKRSLYDHTKIVTGKSESIKGVDYFTIPFELKFDNIKQVVIPYSIDEYLKMNREIQQAFVKAVARRKSAERQARDNTDTTNKQ